MNYVRLGRGVGIGARLAGKALTKALEPSSAAATAAVSGTTASRTAHPAQAGGTEAADPGDAPTRVAASAQVHAARQRASVHQRGKAVAHGAKKFGEAVWGPFAHAGRTLWLEVAGVFFAVFALFFGQQTWALRASFARGPDQRRLLALAVVFLMFVYLSSTSFARSRRKAHKR